MHRFFLCLFILSFTFHSGTLQAQWIGEDGSVRFQERSEETILASRVRGEALERALSLEERKRLHPFFQGELAQFRTSQKVAPWHDSAALPPGITEHPSRGLVYDAIVYVNDFEGVETAGVQLNSRMLNFGTARLTAADLDVLAASESVRYVSVSEARYPALSASLRETGVNLLHAGFINGTPYRGEGALIVIFDTGIDWEHVDFRDPLNPEQTRIAYLWDVTLNATGSETPPDYACCNYGVEYSKAEIDAALAGGPAIRSRDTHSHGTHVAGIAAGNGPIFTGVAPEASLVVVRGGASSFSQADIINGLQYAKEKANLMGLPVVVNLSLGGFLGPHDGTRPDELVIDHLSQDPGYVVVAAVGNSGTMRIHKSGSIGPLGSSSIEIDIPSFKANSGSENDFLVVDVWFDAGEPVDVTVVSPNQASSRTFEHGTETVEFTEDGAIDILNEVDIGNGHTRVRFRLEDLDAERPPAPGKWEIHFTNRSKREMAYSARWATASGSLARGSIVGANTTSTLGQPATARQAISVGNYVSTRQWIYDGGGVHTVGGNRHALVSTSSRGPTRDGRIKPEVGAPGYFIAAARSSHASTPNPTFIATGQRHVYKSGTSMAAPHVAGIAALLLSQNPGLTAEQVKKYLTDNARSDNHTGSTPNFNFGYGKVDALSAMADVTGNPAPISRESIEHYAGHADVNKFYRVSRSRRLGILFRPAIEGIVSSIQFHAANVLTGSGNLIVSIHELNNGKPGLQVGSAVEIPIKSLTRKYFNTIDLTHAEIMVASDRTYVVQFASTGSGDNVQFLFDDGKSLTANSIVSTTSGSVWASLTETGPETTREAVVAVEIAGESGPLPVELVAFEGLVKGNSALLSWTTESERSNHGFEVQHAVEGSFRTVDFVEGRGNSAESVDYRFEVVDLLPGRHRFRIKQIDSDGGFTFSPTIELFVEMPEQFHLTAAYPNPFNPQTQFSLVLARDQEVTVDVFNSMGQRVAVLHDGELAGGETHTFTFAGSQLSSGLYLYRVTGRDFSTTRQMLLVK